MPTTKNKFTNQPQMSIITRFLKDDELEHFKEQYLLHKDMRGRRLYTPTKLDIAMYNDYLKNRKPITYYAKELGVVQATVVNRFFMIATDKLS